MQSMVVMMHSVRAYRSSEGVLEELYFIPGCDGKGAGSSREFPRRQHRCPLGQAPDTNMTFFPPMPDRSSPEYAKRREAYKEAVQYVSVMFKLPPEVRSSIRVHVREEQCSP